MVINYLLNGMILQVQHPETRSTFAEVPNTAPTSPKAAIRVGFLRIEGGVHPLTTAPAWGTKGKKKTPEGCGGTSNISIH